MTSLSSLSWIAQAAELAGVKMADEAAVGGHKLVLNGLGLRKATFLKVKVYVGSLYLEAKSGDAAGILASPGFKRVEMAFVRDVGAGKLRDAWADDLKDNCDSGCGDYKAPLAKLQAAMADMKDGERMAFDFYPAKVDVWVKGAQAASIEDPRFSQALLKIWLGSHPPNDDLKTGMLGLASK